MQILSFPLQGLIGIWLINRFSNLVSKTQSLINRLFLSYLIAFGITGLASGDLSAQKLDGACVKEYTVSYFKDGGKYLISPIKWKGRQWLTAGAAVGVGAGLYFLDEKINDQFSVPSAQSSRNIKYGLSYFGNGFYTMPLMAGMFIHGLAAKNQKSFSTSLMGVKSFVLATVVTRAVKYSANRYRPLENRGAAYFAGPFEDFSLSLPSGHTTGAFAVATVLARNYRDTKWVPVVSYGIAGAVGLSRIYQKEHWASDVFLGAVIGWSMGMFVSEVDCNKELSGLKSIPGGFAYVF